MSHRRMLGAALCALIAILLAVMVTPAAAGPRPSKPTGPLPTNCPYRQHTPKAVDSSENPPPGSAAPTPLPVPPQPVGGKRMGECGTALPADAPPLPPHLRFQSWVIFDAESGQVLAARDPHARLLPASLAKMLLALTAVRELDRKQVVTGTQVDANAVGTKVGIGPGGHYTVDQLMHGLLMHSGNDVAHALATQLGGVPAALRKENALAHSFGALDTRMASPSGLDKPGMSTSAYDLALIFKRLLHNRYLRSIIHTRRYHFPGFGKRRGFPVANDNRLLRNYPGDIGGKTGYTDDARHTFANAARQHGHEVGLIMMYNDNQLAGMYRNALALTNYGFALEASGTAPVGELVAGPQAKQAKQAVPPSAARDAHYAGGAQTGEHHGLRGLSIGLALIALVLALLAVAVLWRRASRRRG